MDIPAHLFLTLPLAIMLTESHSLLQSHHMNFFRSLLLIWNRKVSSFLPRLAPILFKYCQTYPNVVICRQINQMMEGIARGVSAGVNLCDSGIRGRNDNAPTPQSRHIRAWCSRDDVVISIVAPSVLKRNKSVRCYV